MLRPRRPIGQSDDLHALAPEDLVEAGCELGVPIAEQEAGLDLAILEEPCQLTGLLDHPGPGGRGCAAREVDAAAADLQEEEDVKAREPDRLHGEEVDRQHLLGVLTDELAPGALAAAWGRQESVLPQDVGHGAGRQAAAELQEFALDPAVSPPRVLAGEPKDQLLALEALAGPAAWWSPSVERPLPMDQLPVPAQQRIRLTRKVLQARRERSRLRR
jgi:hypothetical protein